VALIDDQIDGNDGVLLGRFITATVAACELIVEEAVETPNHADRMALAKRLMIGNEAPNFGKSMLRLALARNARLAQPRTTATDEQIAQIVARYIDKFAVGQW
jgi:hypothetical protein